MKITIATPCESSVASLSRFFYTLAKSLKQFIRQPMRGPCHAHYRTSESRE